MYDYATLYGCSDLGYNELTEIPPIVFQFRKLTGLYVYRSSVLNVYM